MEKQNKKDIPYADFEYKNVTYTLNDPSSPGKPIPVSTEKRIAQKKVREELNQKPKDVRHPSVAPKSTLHLNEPKSPFFGKLFKKEKKIQDIVEKRSAIEPPKLGQPSRKRSNSDRDKTTRKARANIKAAKALILQKNGLKAVTSPKYVLLSLSQVTLSQPYILIVALLIAGIILMIWLYGGISAVYALYVLKAIPAVIANVFLTIGNAVLFAINGLVNLILSALLTIINSVFHFFIQPLVNAINILSLGEDIIIPWLGADLFEAATYQPTHAFAYWYPNPVVWGDWSSALTYTPIKMGAAPYVVGEYVEVASQSGATLFFPKYDEFMIASGWWDTIATEPTNVMFIFPDYKFWDWSKPFIDVAIAATSWTIKPLPGIRILSYELTSGLFKMMRWT